MEPILIVLIFILFFNKYRNTPLHYALSNKYYEIADLLIQNKANDNIKNIYGLTPW